MSLEVDYEPSEQVFCTIIVCIGSLIGGYSLAWSSPISRILSNPDYYPPLLVISSDQMRWIFLWVPIGATVGALLAGLLADLVGRKLILLFSTVIYTAAWIVATLAEEVFILHFTRFIVGLNVGIYSVVVPLYVIEIADDSIRGRLGIHTYLFFTLGVLLVHILGILNSYFILCFVVTILAVIFLFSQLFIPETPTYLLANNRKEEAMYSLKRLRNPHDNVETQMEELQIYLQNVTSVDESFWKIFTKVNVKSVFIAVTLMIFHQTCGFNATFILSNSGGTPETCCIIILACLQSLVTFIASTLVDKVGRKVLLEISSIITSVSLLTLSFYFWSRPWSIDDSYYLRWMLFISLVTYFAAFSIGLGPTSWLIVPEILSPQIRAIGMSIAVGCGWLGFSLLSFLYLSLQTISYFSYFFWVLAVFSFASFFFTIFILVETKDKPLQKIYDEFLGLKLNTVDIAK